MTGSIQPRPGDVQIAAETASCGATVELRGVSKTYRTGAGLPVSALADVSLAITAGQAVAITGASG